MPKSKKPAFVKMPLGTTLAVYFLFLLSLIPLKGWTQQQDWPDSIPWWKANNLRVIQTNLPAYEAATLDPDSLVADLIHFSANTLIINAGGIMACTRYRSMRPMSRSSFFILWKRLSICIQ